MRPVGGVLSLLVLLSSLPALAQSVDVRPTRETQPVVSGQQPEVRGAALWMHPTDPKQSLLLVADAYAGLLPFTLEGAQRPALPEGPAVAVDVQEGFFIEGKQQALVVVSYSVLQGLFAYVVDPSSRTFRSVVTSTLVPGNVYEAVALYAGRSGRYYAFTASQPGTVRQLELSVSTNDKVQASLVRTLSLSKPVAGLVVDDVQGSLFIAEQGGTLWRYGAEPTDGETRTEVAVTGSPGFQQIQGGLSLYTAGSAQGYLLTTSATSGLVGVYQRAAPYSFVGTFSMVADGGIDAVESSLAVVAESRSVGEQLFSQGMVAVHDRVDDSTAENFKLLPWPSVAGAFSPSLVVYTPPDGGNNGTPGDGGLADGGRGPGGGGGSIGDPGGGGGIPDDSPSGCSCAVASVPGGVLLALVGLARRVRRRRP